MPFIKLICVWPKCLYCCSIHFPVGCNPAEFAKGLLVSTCALPQHRHYLSCRSLIQYSKKSADILQDSYPQYDVSASEFRHSVRNTASWQICHKILRCMKDAIIVLPKELALNNVQCSSDLPWRRPSCWAALLINILFYKVTWFIHWRKLKIYLFL